MHRTRLSIFACALPLLGCAELKIPTTPSAAYDILGQTRDYEAKLVAALNAENQVLLHLSGGHYSCGDPRDPIIRRYTGHRDTDEWIKQRFDGDKVWRIAYELLEQYKKALTEINESASKDAANVKGLADLATALSTASSAPVTPFIAPIANLATLAARARRHLEVRELAATMQPLLEDAIPKLLREFPTLNREHQDIFRAWDNCSRERLRYTRDIATTGIANHRAMVAPSTGVEQTNAYFAYLAKRSELRPPPPQPVVDALTKVLAESKALADGTSPLQRPDPASLAQAIQSINTIVRTRP
jgi:hypothetical protein